MEQLRPILVPDPQRRAGLAAKTSLGRAFLTINHRMPFADRTTALDLQRLEIAHDVDRVTAAAAALAADRAIAAPAGEGGLAVARVFDRAEAAGAFRSQQIGFTPIS